MFRQEVCCVDGTSALILCVCVCYVYYVTPCFDCVCVSLYFLIAAVVALAIIIVTTNVMLIVHCIHHV